MSRPLCTYRDYRAAMARLEKIHPSARPGTPEGDEYERLSASLTAYEAQHGLGRAADLPPGSAAARTAGCICPQFDNDDLEDIQGNPPVVLPGCPVHGPCLAAARVGGTSLRLYDRIAREWGLSSGEQMGLLHIPESTYGNWMAAALAGHDVAVDDATLERLAQIQAIDTELKVLLPASHAEWGRRPNSAPVFGGEPPLALMLADPRGIAAVASHLHSWHGGWSS